MLYINMLSHGSEGVDVSYPMMSELYISVISHGSEGMDMWRTVQIWRAEKEGYFVKWIYCSNFMVWSIDFIWISAFLLWKIGI